LTFRIVGTPGAFPFIAGAAEDCMLPDDGVIVMSFAGNRYHRCPQGSRDKN
jgi:hypothetical protein